VTEMAVRADPSVVVGRLEERIRSYGAPRAIVAFSGGVDSSTVLALAVRALGADSVTGITAISPSYPAGELDHAERVAAAIGVAHRTIETMEVEREAYARNDGERCFHCKTELYATIGRLLRLSGDAAVLAGANADDVGDFRPGIRAGRQRGVRNPLLEEGLRKDEVRAVARELGLWVADKPALACLSSRVAFGVRITPDLLTRIDQAECLVRDLGFDVVRVRHFGDRASIEVDDVAGLLAHPDLPSVRARLESMGWRRVDVDLKGYRAGSMNRTLVSDGGTVPIKTHRGGNLQ
jgi:uncharacterized protein